MEKYNELEEFAKDCGKAKKIFIDISPMDDKGNAFVISCTAKIDDYMIYQDVVKADKLESRHKEIAQILSKVCENLRSGAMVK